jgi:hypothetical protein
MSAHPSVATGPVVLIGNCCGYSKVCLPSPTHAQYQAPLLSFNCSKVVGCTYMYSLDGDTPIPVGNASADSGGPAPPVLGAAVDTALLVAPPLASRNATAVFAFDGRVPAGTAGTVVIDIRVDDAELWTPIAANASYFVTDLVEGVHTIAARARWVCRGWGLLAVGSGHIGGVTSPVQSLPHAYLGCAGGLRLSSQCATGRSRGVEGGRMLGSVVCVGVGRVECPCVRSAACLVCCCLQTRHSWAGFNASVSGMACGNVSGFIVVFVTLQTVALVARDVFA